MGSALVTSLSHIASGRVLSLLMIGVGIGLFTGLLPGLGGVVVLTLLIPFVIHMSPFEAFALLLSVYSVFTITGDITTILVGIPAHPECAAMLLDGYPMTKRGESARALGAAVTSAGLGAFVGAALLAVSIPLLKSFVVDIGYPQLFCLIVLGLTMIGSLSGRSAITGMITASFGVLLATIGTNVSTGIGRYSFGSLYLLTGVGLVPLALGLFAIPELIGMHARGTKGIAEMPPPVGSGRMTGVFETFRRPSVVIRGAIIGGVTAVLPGLGSSVGQWAAYGQAANISKQSEKFGTGYIDGVIAPGASNNAKEGGALVPTLAFGVPGSAAMAILLGVFTILGLVPGPDMLSKNLDITYFMMWVLVIANLVGCVISIVLLKPLARIAFLPGAILVPIVVCLIFIGAGASTGQWGDLVTLLLAGAAAWIIRWAGWSIIPMVLGFVLGSLLETDMWISVDTYGTHWLTFPSVDILLAVALGLAISTSLRRWRQKQRGAANAVLSRDEERRRAKRSLGLAIVFIAIGTTALILALPWPKAASLFPITFSSVLIGLCLFEVGRDVWRLVSLRSDGSAEPVAVDAHEELDMRPTGVADESSEARVSEVVSVGASASLGAAVGGPLRPPEEGGEVLISAADPHAGDTADATSSSNAATQMIQGGVPAASRLQVLEMAAWLVLSAITVYLVGYTYGLAAFVFAYLLRTHHGFIRSAISGALVGVLFYYIFVKALAITLPIPYIGPSFH